MEDPPTRDGELASTSEEALALGFEGRHSREQQAHAIDG
jgi:hypothetical protein